MGDEATECCSAEAAEIAVEAGVWVSEVWMFVAARLLPAELPRGLLWRRGYVFIFFRGWLHLHNSHNCLETQMKVNREWACIRRQSASTLSVACETVASLVAEMGASCAPGGFVTRLSAS